MINFFSSKISSDCGTAYQEGLPLRTTWVELKFYLINFMSYDSQKYPL